MITANEIDSAKVGTELDSLVARSIGLELIDGRWYGKHPHTEGAKAHASVCLPIPLYGISYDGTTGLPHFSTDYAAAFALFILATEGFGGVSVYSDMEDWGEEHPVCVGVLDTQILWRPFPEAMCLAYLKAAEQNREIE
jgi:hypothetical protein